MFTTEALPIPEPISEQGPVASLIYLAVAESTHPLTVDEIAEAVTRPITSVRRVAADLANADLVARHPDPNDMRRYVYDLPREM